MRGRGRPVIRGEAIGMSAQSKGEVRLELRASSKDRSAAERSAGSAALVQHLLERPEWANARGILGFHPLAEEPDLRPALRAALHAGKLLALPRFSPETGLYQAFLVHDLGSDLVIGRFGVMEPGPGCPQATINHLDLGLIPGVGFDFAGRRLGRGGGHYDRLLARFPGLKCGVAFEWQLPVEIPMESHDVPRDCLLTPVGWRVVQRGGGLRSQ